MITYSSGFAKPSQGFRLLPISVSPLVLLFKKSIDARSIDERIHRQRNDHKDLNNVRTQYA